jgi:hypothetical protein
MAVKYYKDFSGGYANHADQTSLPDNVMGNIEGMYWDGGLKKRRGAVTLASSTAAGATSIYGIIHDYLYGTGFIAAIADATHVHFYAWDATTGWTTIGTKTFTLNYENVYFSYINGYIVATNGYDKPLAISYSGGTYSSNDLEQVDARTRDNADWVAGQYTAVGTIYTDDHVDAQDADANDFQYVSTTNGDGFYMGCFYTFSKCVFTNATQAAGVVVVYEYSKAANTWGTLTPTTTPNFTAATGDKTLEFDVPLDWAVWEDDTATDLVNKYLIRARFTTAPAGAQTMDLIVLSYTRSVSFALQNQSAVIVTEHGGRLWISAGEIVAYSAFNSALGWEPYFIEYFQGGTKAISNLVSHKNALYVFKNSITYKYSGTSFDNYIKTKIADIGTRLPSAAVSAGENIFFISDDGGFIISSDTIIEAMNHVIFYTGLPTTVTYMTYFGNKIWTGTPGYYHYVIDINDITNIDNKPSVAVFKIGSTSAHKKVCSRYSSTAYLYGIGTGAITVMRYESGVYEDEATGSAASTTLVKTKLLDFSASSTRKVVPRIKVEALDGADLLTKFVDDSNNTIVSGTQSAKLDFGNLTNIISNGGFEQALTTGWTEAVGTAVGTSRDTATKRTGAASLKIKPVHATATDTGIAQSFTPSDYAIHSYYITGYYNCTSFTEGTVVIDVGSALTHASSFIYANLATISAATSGWVRFEKAVSVRLGTDVQAYLKVYSPTGSSSTCYIDDITMYPLTKFVTYDFSVPYQVDGKNFALELSQTSLAETSIKSIGIEYSPRRF